jgi:hypothetical protein
LVLPPGEPFDLNIEEIPENWEIYDGIREVIANDKVLGNRGIKGIETQIPT